MKEGSKYFPLYTYLRELDRDRITLTFSQVEALIDGRLPATALAQRGWWSNRSSGAVQARAWMDAGYHVEEVDLDARTVTLQRPGLIYEVQREGDTILWDGDLVKALRHYTGWTQAELAERLGMRQQTISEWETGAYLPKRSTSKFLTLIAEEAGFYIE